MANHCYNLSPFGTGIFCTICEFPIKARSSISKAIGHHEANSKTKHSIKTELDVRKTIEKSFPEDMKRFAGEVRDSPSLGGFLSNFLEPQSTFPFCSHTDCCMPVFDKIKHKSKRHVSFCENMVDGYVPKHWKKNSPKIVTAPANMSDTSIFNATFLSYYDAISERDTSNGDETIHRHADLAQILEDQSARYEQHQNDGDIVVSDQRVEPNLWLHRTGWDEYLSKCNFNMRELLTLKSPITENDPKILQISTRIRNVLSKAVAYARALSPNNPALFEVKRIHTELPPEPFNARLTNETWTRYMEVLQTIVVIIFRMENDGSQIKTEYILTEDQRHYIRNILTNDIDEITDETFIQMIMSLISNEIEDEPERCVFLSALSVYALKDELRFSTSAESTSFFAAIFGIYRALVLYKAKYFTESIELKFVARVQSLTNKFLSHPKYNKPPGPISWMLQAFNYGVRISKEENAAGICSWDGETITRGKVSLSITNFRHMLSTTVKELNDTLVLLLNALDSDGSTSNLNAFPPIRWAEIHDDVNNKHPGYSFLTEPTNHWISKDVNFVMESVINSKIKSDLWYRDNQIRKDTLHRYEVLLSKFRDQLLGLIHLTGGQPARSTEISNLRFRNTETIRNIFIEGNLVCVKTKYHKTMLQSNRGKHIHRYLPNCVGELLVYYLWLVLPFWYTMKGFESKATCTSSYLWSKEFVFNVEKGDRRSVTTWNSEKLSSILRSMAMKTIGVPLDVSTWRHMAIAITRRYLNDPYDDEGDNEGNSDEICHSFHPKGGMICVHFPYSKVNLCQVRHVNLCHL